MSHLKKTIRDQKFPTALLRLLASTISTTSQKLRPRAEQHLKYKRHDLFTIEFSLIMEEAIDK